MPGQFHFLRPELLWFLPLVLVLWWVLRQKARRSNSWNQILPAEFLQALSTGQSGKQTSVLTWLWPTSLLLAILALAGPTWYQQETPTGLKEDPVVIVFDLSLSMLATDQSPNRLKKAQQKLYDIVQYRREGQTGLVAFAGSAHVVSPLTEDSDTLRAMIPALDPFIMPELGSNAASGVLKAVEALEQTGSRRGRILLMTDGIEPSDIPTIEDAVKKAGAELSVIGVGTADGGPIPIPNRGFIKQNNEIVVARPNFADMQTIATNSGGRFTQLTLDNRDIRYTLPDQELLLSSDDGSGQTSLDWHDAGYWLLFPIMVLALWQYRRSGITIMLALVITTYPDNSYAIDWQDLWKTPDQQAQEAYNQEDYATAGQLFNDPLWRGMAHYKAGEYEEAAKAFASVDTPQSHFNRGNALVQQQQFEEALKAYERALKEAPDFEAARDNKEKLEQFLKQQQQQSKNSPNQDQQQNGQDNNSQDQPSQNQSSQDENTSGQSGGQENEQAGSQSQQSQSDAQQQRDQQAQSQPDQNSDSQTDEQNQQTHENQQADNGNEEESQKEAQQSQALSSPENETEQSQANEESSQSATLADEASLKDQQTEQWLRRIPDDPGGLLRRKFLQQHQSNNRRQSNDNNGRTIW
ncbi:vWA domain-containing protein [Hahella ganghwensis]|uniref:vWA domain-containing protein n=1 Tax=Hahella ganghwensis TaxID=286420 RepID=UPI00035DAF0B|nr:VWA domain-containing protein [Hahella ganghwensis]